MKARAKRIPRLASDVPYQSLIKIWLEEKLSV